MQGFLKKHWPYLVLVIASLFIVWPLFSPGYFPHHDYLQVIRIFDMRRCIEDFQIPCRWVPDMGFGYGFPTFNYYGVFPYYIGAFLSFLTGYLIAAKALFFIVLISGGITMYILGKELFGRMGGFVVGILYLFAPYRALDSYVRGAISESFALAIIPLVFYYSLRLIREPVGKNLLGFTISLGVFLMNHNVMTMYFVPFLLAWIFYWVFFEKIKPWKQILIGLILGIGLAAFFIFPAFIEKNLVQIDNLKESELIPNFRAHFVTINQLFFSRFWGYGASTWGDEDGISFQIGWPHWWLLVGLLIAITHQFILDKKFSIKVFVQKNSLAIFLLFTFTVSILMTHNKSAFIWEEIDLLQFSQFPWRFLSVSIFTVSLLGGVLVLYLNKKLQYIYIVVTALLTIWFNWQFFVPARFDNLVTDKTLLTGEQWDFQREGAILDYLPLNAKVPRELAPSNPRLIKGDATVRNFQNKSNYWRFEANVRQPSQIELPIFDFPNWRVFVNNQDYVHYFNKDFGTIEVNLKENGEYIIEGRFFNTTTRTISNSITLISLIIIGLIYAKIIKI